MLNEFSVGLFVGGCTGFTWELAFGKRSKWVDLTASVTGVGAIAHACIRSGREGSTVALIGTLIGAVATQFLYDGEHKKHIRTVNVATLFGATVAFCVMIAQEGT